MEGLLNFLHPRYFLKWSLSSSLGWPPRYNIRIEFQTKELPQIRNTLLVFPKGYFFSKCEDKDNYMEGELYRAPVFTLQTCVAAAFCFLERLNYF